MAKKQETYEEMIKRLEEIVVIMEGNKINLEDAMKNYEEGVALSNKLLKLLNEAESKIKILSNGEEKNFIENKADGE